MNMVMDCAWDIFIAEGNFQVTYDRYI